MRVYDMAVMEPRIQYAKTSDGVSIAFWTLGEGEPPLVQMPRLPYSHIQLEWHNLDYRQMHERLAQKRRLVRYDPRGTGLSYREPVGLSLDAFVKDVEAVVDRLHLERFVLYGVAASGLVAIAYAARHPERVSHLVLWCAAKRGTDFSSSAQFQGLVALLDKDWDLFTNTSARFAFGWADAASAGRFAAFLRDSVTPDAAKAFYQALEDFDVTDLLPRVTSPTLVIHHRQVPYPGLDVSKDLAAELPNARLVVLEGSWLTAYLGDHETVATAIDEFLIEDEPREPAPDLPSGTAVILFADIVDSTGLTEGMGDAAFREKARDLDSSLRSFIRDNGGTPVEGKLVGDGLMAVFTSARQAIEAALRCGQAGDECDLRLHLGVHAGDVIREANNVYGGAVNIASRISGLSAPGEVLVSDTVRGLARTSAGVSFEDRGEHPLKGIAEPMRLWAVRFFDSPSANASGGSG